MPFYLMGDKEHTIELLCETPYGAWEAPCTEPLGGAANRSRA